MAGRQAADEAAEAGDVVRSRARTLSRSFSSVSSSPLDASISMMEADEPTPEFDTIPPLPLHALFSADRDESGAQQTEDGEFCFIPSQ